MQSCSVLMTLVQLLLRLTLALCLLSVCQVCRQPLFYCMGCMHVNGVMCSIDACYQQVLSCTQVSAPFRVCGSVSDTVALHWQDCSNVVQQGCLLGLAHGCCALLFAAHVPFLFMQANYFSSMQVMTPEWHSDATRRQTACKAVK